MGDSANAIYRALIDFLRKPVELSPTRISLSQKLKEFGQILLLDIMLMLIIGIPILVIEEAGWIDSDEHALAQMMQNIPLVFLLLLGVLIVPFIEELIFRLPLRYKRNYFLRSVVFIWSGISGKNITEVSSQANQKWNRIYPFIFYFVAMIFGLVHATNYVGGGLTFWVLIPILVAPQFIGGLLIGFLRLRHGFFWGFFLHASNNCLFLVIPMFFSSHEVAYQESNDSFDLTIEEVSPYIPQERRYEFRENGLNVTSYRFKSAAAKGLKKPGYLVEVPKQLSPKKQLNISLTCHSAELNCDSVLLDALMNTYHFRIDSALKLRDALEFIVVDASKLLTYRNPDSEYPGSKMSVSGDLMEFTNISLSSVVKSLSRNYKIPIEYMGYDTLKYDLKLPIRYSDLLHEKLVEEYGIELEEKEKELMHYQLVPESNSQ